MRLKSKKVVEYEDYTYSLTVKDNHNYFIGTKESNVLSKNSQAEVRVLAKLANDKNLLKAFETGLDIHCYSGDTEVFTPDGWVRFDQLTEKDTLLQYDPESKKLSYTNYEYIVNTKPMKGFEFSNSKQRVTSRHRMLIENFRTGNYKEMLAEDVKTNNGSSRFVSTGTYYDFNKSTLSEGQQRLLVAIHDDGYLSKGGVNFEFKKSRKIIRLKTLLEDLGLTYSETYRENKKSTQIRIFAKQSFASKDVLPEVLACLGKDKIIPWKNLDPNIIIPELAKWDGTERDGGVCYDSTDKETVKNLHTLATLGGYKCTSIKSYQKTTPYGNCFIYRVKIHYTRKPYLSLSAEKITPVILETSYCVRVPTGWILTKREGQTVVSGNCYNASLMWNKPQEEVTSIERSMAKGLTFSLLYGTSISEFASKYTKGNIAEARNVMSSFFSNYPNVEKFIYNMHKNGILTDTVPSILGDPIYVDMPSWVFSLKDKDKFILLENPYSKEVAITSKSKNDTDKFHDEREKKERAKLSKAMRNSQNYGIQGSSSLLAGIGMVELQEKIEEENLSAKLECFTHDSADIDLKIKHLIRTLELLPETSIDYLKNKYDIPMKIDIAIGVSNNRMIDLEDIQIKDNIIRAMFSGTEEALHLLRDRVSKNSSELTYKIHETKEKVISIDDLFITTNAYAKALGKPFTVVEGSLELKIQI